MYQWLLIAAIVFPLSRLRFSQTEAQRTCRIPPAHSPQRVVKSTAIRQNRGNHRL
jgi:hypothetical protein